MQRANVARCSPQLRGPAGKYSAVGKFVELYFFKGAAKIARGCLPVT
jgi:hypothetical protein